MTAHVYGLYCLYGSWNKASKPTKKSFNKTDNHNLSLSSGVSHILQWVCFDNHGWKYKGQKFRAANQIIRIAQ